MVKQAAKPTGKKQVKAKPAKKEVKAKPAKKEMKAKPAKVKKKNDFTGMKIVIPSLPSAYMLRLPGKNPGDFVEMPASPQQCQLFDWFKTGAGNAFVEAVAGSGKTTSLTQGCRFMRGSVAMTCFNKKIAVDIQLKLIALGLKNVSAGTFHSFGWSACRNVYRGVKLDARGKRDAMLEHLRPPQLEEFPRNLVGIVTKLVSLAKQSAICKYWIPEDVDRWREIIDHHGLDDEVEDARSIEHAIEFAMRGVHWSRLIAPKIVDFDDMIWIPVINEFKLQQFNWVLVDEAQDTNPARRALAHMMLKPSGRIVFVGDRHQAIYGFTGADSDAVDILIKDFNCTSLPLTVTYRCPQLVVKEAQKYVKHITSWEHSELGLVRKVSKAEFWEKELNNLNPDAAILCRNTAPVVALAFKLIRKNIPCHVEGRDIGQGLITLAKRWKVKDIDGLHTRLEAYVEREEAKLKLKKQESKIQALNDKVETLYILMEGCTTMVQLIAKIENLFKDTEEGNKRTVTLSTVHKAKGREWPRVYILGFDKYMPSKWAEQEWEKEQETNIIYVAITRAQQELLFTEHMEDEEKK